MPLPSEIAVRAAVSSVGVCPGDDGVAGGVGAGAMGEPAWVAGRAPTDRVELDVMASQGEGHGRRHVERRPTRDGVGRDRGRGSIRVATTRNPARHGVQLVRSELVALGVDAGPEHRGPDTGRREP